jgi:hypothetical protein
MHEDHRPPPNNWQSFYEGIELTQEEEKLAILEGKKAKYFRERNEPRRKEMEEKELKKGDKVKQI